MTLCVNREGVPLFGTVESGQRSDKTLNGEMSDRLVDALDPPQLQSLLYVADSAVVTGPNLTRFATTGIPFLSRCPETFGVAGAAKSAAWAADNWHALGVMTDRPTAAQYWASEQTGRIGGRAYRLVVYRSNTLDSRRERTLDREIQAQRRDLERSARTVMTHEFACEADAQQALDHWLSQVQPAWHHITGTIRSQTRHTRPGRPRKSAPLDDSVRTWHVEIAFGALDGIRRQHELERRSTFVLITTVPADRLSAAALLAESKGQVHVERHFHFVKDPLFVDARFVKKPERVEALGYVLLLACLLYSLLERRLRQSGVPVPPPSRRVLQRPTGHEVVRHLQSLQVVRSDDGQRTIALATMLQPTLVAILEGLRMSPAVFTDPPRRESPD